MKNLLIDTNIFVYALDKDSKYYPIASDILLNPKYQCFTTSKNICELCAVASKLKIDKKLLKLYILEIRENVNFLFPNSISQDLFFDLFYKYSPIGNQVFDIEVVSIMLDNKIETIATLNKKDFENIEEIEILS